MNSVKTAGATWHQVDIKDIDDRPGPYCMSFGFDLDLLTESIKRVGLINNPLLIRNKNEKLDIIVGYRRIHALKILGWDKIPCRIIAESDLSPLKCLLLNLHDNIVIRKFNAVEKGMVLSRLCSRIDRNEVLKNYMPILDLPSHAPTLDLFLRLDKESDEDIKTLIIIGELSLVAAKMIFLLDNDAKSIISKLISKFKFNVNQQIQLIEYLNDISFSERKKIRDILEEKPFKTLYSDTRMNNPQKVRALLKVLRKRIFPKLIKAEETFKQTVSILDLPEGIRIYPPPFFEAPNYRMEVLFANGNELKKKIEDLSRTEGLSKLREPWEKDI